VRLRRRVIECARAGGRPPHRRRQQQGRACAPRMALRGGRARTRRRRVRGQRAGGRPRGDRIVRALGAARRLWDDSGRRRRRHAERVRGRIFGGLSKARSGSVAAGRQPVGGARRPARRDGRRLRAGLAGGRREPLAAWTARLVARARGEGSTRAVDLLLGRADAWRRRRVRRRPCRSVGRRRETVRLSQRGELASGRSAARVAAQGANLRRLRGRVLAWPPWARSAAWRDRDVRVRVDAGPWRPSAPTSWPSSTARTRAAA
jgi:hypothetical protein